ncbi:hypothetical protein RRG08_003486 [Elysia crispata]|uniref:Uncharacterized protein n=1 Tax=Elysia crispata TaxID=231223 RepID=A0AAE0Y6K6_9GAST|nr:hypothetical protein RRG08_003486 [Elysia crispata]
MAASLTLCTAAQQDKTTRCRLCLQAADTGHKILHFVKLTKVKRVNQQSHLKFFNSGQVTHPSIADGKDFHIHVSSDSKSLSGRVGGEG